MYAVWPRNTSEQEISIRELKKNMPELVIIEKEDDKSDFGISNTNQKVLKFIKDRYRKQADNLGIDISVYKLIK